MLDILLGMLPWLILIGFIGTILSALISSVRPMRWPFIFMWIGGIILYIIVVALAWLTTDYTMG